MTVTDSRRRFNLNWKNIFNLRGINYWHVANSVGWNILGTGFSLVLTFYFVNNYPDAIMIVQVFLMVTIFIVSFTAGLLFGRLASDGRGLTYGVIGSLPSAALSLFLILPSGGILGLMLALIALAGGFNGGLLSFQNPKH